jgi:hypothetical protein
MRNIRPSLADGISMAPHSDPSPDDTERFALQACPHCAAVDAVLLCVATTVCLACNEPFEVAPLKEASPSATLQSVPAFPSVEPPEPYST